VWLEGASDDEVLSSLSSLQPHAIIDLSSYTVLSRPQVVAAAPACFKVNAVNYPSTMGGVFEDLLLTDPVSSPPEANHMYGEKLLMMPSTGFPAFFADGAAELVPMCMRVSLMRDCGSATNRDDAAMCGSVHGDQSLAALLSTPPPPPSSYTSLLLNFTRSPSSSSLDKASFILVALTSLRASLLATRQFDGADLFQLAEGHLRNTAQECALADRGDACLQPLMGVVEEFMKADPVNEWPQFASESSTPESSSSTPLPSITTPLRSIETALWFIRCNLTRESSASRRDAFMSPRFHPSRICMFLSFMLTQLHAAMI
jgi:hypothetical protein